MKLRSLCGAVFTAALGCFACQGSASAALIRSDTSLPALNGIFVVSFDASPKVVKGIGVTGVSQNAAASTTDLATLILFNSAGEIQALNGSTYGAAVPVTYVANKKFHFAVPVNVPTHHYAVLVTPPGQAQIMLAQADIQKVNFINLAAATGDIVVQNVAVRSVQQEGCVYAANAIAAGLDDGCGGALGGLPQYSALLTKYGTRRPPFDVAGVEYPVGVPPGTLHDPSTAALPAGCTYGSNVVTCKQNNTTVSDYDFSLHGEIQLVVTGGVSNILITRNKFSQGTACKDPVINITGGGSVVFSHNTIDGGGALCAGKLAWGSLFNGNYANGATVTIEYNEFYAIPQDATNNRGPNSGAASIVERYNLFYLQGYTGHPDGIQLNGGNFNPIDVSFNTYYNTSPPNTVAGTQPFHLEAQLTAAISNSTVTYNTMLTPGTCNGGRNWPNGCTVNYDIACKYDGTGNSNTNYSAYGNYIDWTGAIKGLLNGGCSNVTFGSPVPNRDLNTGGVLTP